MSRNLGCFLFDVVNDAEKEILTLFNSLLAYNPDINGSLFTSNYQNVIHQLKKFSVFPTYDAKYYYGDMLVWDVISLDMVRQFPNLNKIFYFQGPALPWMGNTHIEYKMWEKLFCNPKITIITNNKDIKDVYDHVWSSECKLLQQINWESLYEAIR